MRQTAASRRQGFEEAGAVVSSAEAKKITKYTELARTHHVTPWQLGHPECLVKGTELDRWTIQITGDPLTRCCMTEQISVALQRGNAASVLGTTDQSTPFDSSCNFTLALHQCQISRLCLCILLLLLSLLLSIISIASPCNCNYACVQRHRA